MNFLAPILLWGGAAVSIPILVHLFNKNRYRIREWGAMHLIEQTIKVQKRRLRIENWLLLLLRMMIPLLLWLFMSKPQITGLLTVWDWLLLGVLTGFALGGIYLLIRSRAGLATWAFCLAMFAIPGWLALSMATHAGGAKAQLLGDSESSLIVMIDDSYSLEYEDPQQGRLIEDARARAKELVAGLKKGSNVQVIRLSGGPLFDGPRSNLEKVEREDLDKVETGFGMANPALAFKEAATQLASGKMKPLRDVLVLTDFQAVSWPTNTISALRQAVDGMGTGEDRPLLSLMHIGPGDKLNVCVTGLDYSDMPLAPREKLKVRATLKYFGKDKQTINGLPVEFAADGSPDKLAQSVHTVDFAGNGTEPVKAPFNESVEFSFDTPGTHVISATAKFGGNDNQDRLRADDTQLASVEVWDNVPVLILDGAPSANSLAGNIDLDGETDFLRLALQPFAAVEVKNATDLINARVIRATDFNEAAIADARVVIMANVKQLTDAQTVTLKQYVRQGGGLMIFLGDQVDVNWYNAQLGNEGYLPANIGTLRDLTAEKVPFARVLVDPPDGDPDPVMAMFAEEVDISARVHKWYRLNRPAEARTYQELAFLNTPGRDSFLLSRKAGDGRVLLCTTTCDEDWFSGIGAPFYVPLMQRLTLHLAAAAAPNRNLTVGESLRARFPRDDIDKEVQLAFYPLGKISVEAIQMRAEAETETLKIISNGGRGLVVFDRIQRPGLYVLKRPDDSLVHYVVSTDRAESDLTQLGAAEIEQLAGNLGAQLVTDVGEYRTQKRERREGKDVWKWFVAAMLVLIIGELVLVQGMSRDKA